MEHRKNHIKIGQLGEQFATTYLEDLEFHILEKNWRYKRLEVDIIASKEDIVHFIEVKTRTSKKYGNPEEAVSTSKMSFLKSAAEQYQYLHPQWKKVQFDVVAIQLRNEDIEEIFVNWDVYF